MYGNLEKLTCPFCHKEYIESYGITPFYEYKGKTYLKEQCQFCNTKYFRPSTFFGTNGGTEGSIPASEVNEEEMWVNGVCCF